MTKYINTISITKIWLIHLNITFMILYIFLLIIIKNKSDFLPIFIGYTVFVQALDIAFFSIRKTFYTTYFDNSKIEQRLFLKRKSIVLKDVVHIICIREVLYLSKEIVDISALPPKKLKAMKELSDKIAIMLGPSDDILVLLSKIENCKLDMIHPYRGIKYRIEKYFKD